MRYGCVLITAGKFDECEDGGSIPYSGTVDWLPRRDALLDFLEPIQFRSCIDQIEDRRDDPSAGVLTLSCLGARFTEDLCGRCRGISR